MLNNLRAQVEISESSIRQIAFLFPGQGAQYVGMAKDFYDHFSEAKELFQAADDILARPLSHLIFKGNPEELTQTENSQPAIFIASLAALRVLQKQFPDLSPVASAGLSLGEYSALCAAGKIDFIDALLLVQARAVYMQRACGMHQGTMRVVLGMDLSVVEELLSSLRIRQYPVWVANVNCPGQIVISGSIDAIEEASSQLKEIGARRILPLNVSGAFHSGLMKDAQDALAPKIEQVVLHASDVGIVMNVPGDYVTDPEEIRSHLIQQITGTVRWEQGVRAMMRAGVTRFLEIGCGETLSGMNKKIGIPHDAILHFEKMQDLETIEGYYALGV
jgi:[acyl-carrier-protein] S-malonyltransferase